MSVFGLCPNPEGALAPSPQLLVSTGHGPALWDEALTLHPGFRHGWPRHRVRSGAAQPKAMATGREEMALDAHAFAAACFFQNIRIGKVGNGIVRRLHEKEWGISGTDMGLHLPRGTLCL